MAITTTRFGITPSTDNTDRVLTNDYQTPDYAASIAITTKHADTRVKVAELTGALTVTAGVGTASTAPYVCDTMTLLFATDSTQRIVTLSTGISASGTITIPADKKASLTLTFDGATWVETGRAIEA